MFKINRKIGPKGQIVLPKDIREEFNLRTGSNVVFIINDHQIIIEPAKNPEQIIEEFCTLPDNLKKTKINAKEIKKLIEEQYEERLKIK